MTYIIGHNTETSRLSQEEYAQRHNAEVSNRQVNKAFQIKEARCPACLLD
jgi:hypothetical protein